MKVRKLILSAVPLMLVLAASIAPASAAQQPVSPPSTDAAQYADAFGVTVEEATQRLSLQGKFGMLKERVREVAGGRLVRASTEHEDFYGVAVSLSAGPTIPEVDEILASHGIEYRVDYAPVLTETEGNALVEQLAATILRDVPGVDGLYYDGATGSIFVDYSGTPHSAKLLEAETIANKRGAQFRVNHYETPSTDGRYGGVRSLSGPDDGRANCTTGFVLDTGTGGLRTTTAGHCPNQA